MCPVLVSYFSIVCCMIVLHMFLDFDSLYDSMFAQFSIIVASLVRASFSYRLLIDLGMGVRLKFDVFVHMFSVRAR